MNFGKLDDTLKQNGNSSNQETQQGSYLGNCYGVYQVHGASSL